MQTQKTNSLTVATRAVLEAGRLVKGLIRHETVISLHYQWIPVRIIRVAGIFGFDFSRK